MSDHAIAATPLTQRTITELDQVRLEKLLDAHGTPEPLGDCLLYTSPSPRD